MYPSAAPMSANTLRPRARTTGGRCTFNSIAAYTATATAVIANTTPPATLAEPAKSNTNALTNPPTTGAPTRVAG